jgi:hypothetical protein
VLAPNLHSGRRGQREKKLSCFIGGTLTGLLSNLKCSGTFVGVNWHTHNVYPDRTLNRSHTLPDNQCDIAKLMLVCNQLTWIACFNIGLRWWMIEYPRLREW